MTCQKILIEYLRDNPDWHKKVHLYAVAEDYSPETVERRLRLMEKAGEIVAGYYNGKYANNLAKYIIKGAEPEIRKPQIIINDNGERVAII